jgi:hypothetical protein
MKKLSLLFVVIIAGSQLFAQAECSKCLLPKISLFDAEVAIPKPAGEKALWEYEQLFWPMKFANAYIFNNDPSRQCFRFIDKAFIGGKATTGNEPAPEGKFMHDELNYLITSTVTGTGENSRMVLEIQTSCDRKTVASTEVSFSWSDGPDALEKAGHQAALQLMPLEEKIMDYAKRMRETNNLYMLSGKNAEIKIKPKKTKLGVGEETEVDIQAIDCDGYLLKNRKIVFTRGSLNGMVINGTEGGVVSPSTVITDEQGKAKVKFKLTRADGNATIYAHFLGLNPAGCNDVVFGRAHIGGIPVQVSLDYIYHNSQEAIANPKLLHQVQTSLGLSTWGYKRHTLRLLCYPAKPLQNDFSLSIPSKSGEPPIKVKYLRDDGVYMTLDKATGDLAALAIDGEFEKGDRKRIRTGNADSSKHTWIKLDWNGSDIAELQIEFNYKPFGDQDLNDPVKDAYFFRSSKGARFEKNAITDKGSPYKWEYVITLHRVDKLVDGRVMGTVMSYGGETEEDIVLRILTP